jgi:hypothetical protein
VRCVVSLPQLHSNITPIGDEDLFTEDNPYEGITFYTINNTFAAAIGSGRQNRTLGFFGTLNEAIAARRAALNPERTA